jgi:hypothetical protein
MSYHGWHRRTAERAHDLYQWRADFDFYVGKHRRPDFT